MRVTDVPLLPDGTPAAGFRDYQDMAVLDRAAGGPGAQGPAVGARADQRLDPGPGPEEDVQVPGQRADPHAAGRAVRGGRPALLGLPGRAGHGYLVRYRADEGGPPPRGQGAERVEVRAGPGLARCQPGGTQGSPGQRFPGEHPQPPLARTPMAPIPP